MLYIELTWELVKIFRILPAQNIQLTLKYRFHMRGLQTTVVYQIQWSADYSGKLQNTLVYRTQGFSDNTVVTKKMIYIQFTKACRVS